MILLDLGTKRDNYRVWQIQNIKESQNCRDLIKGKSGGFINTNYEKGSLKETKATGKVTLKMWIKLLEAIEQEPQPSGEWQISQVNTRGYWKWAAGASTCWPNIHVLFHKALQEKTDIGRGEDKTEMR